MGFLRTGELTVPGDNVYDSAVHLSYSDITADNPSNSQVIRITTKQSKTDHPFRKGIDLYLGRTVTYVCPVLLLINYLLIESITGGPLFRFKDRCPLTIDNVYSSM